VAFDVWPRSAARAASKKETTKGDGAAPECGLGEVAGEGTGSGGARSARGEDARQVFDETLSTRARLREAKRKSTREMACSGMIKGSRGMLLARWLGQRD
jgi:hypothetical protein